jgi:hypothetical protein
MYKSFYTFGNMYYNLTLAGNIRQLISTLLTMQSLRGDGLQFRKKGCANLSSCTTCSLWSDVMQSVQHYSKWHYVRLLCCSDWKTNVRCKLMAWYIEFFLNDPSNMLFDELSLFCSLFPDLMNSAIIKDFQCSPPTLHEPLSFLRI